MTALLITGSRDASPPMLAMAENAVLRARSLGWSIVVGDAHGIDERVVKACVLLQVPFACYGITSKARNLSGELWKRYGTYTQVSGNYLARDRHMVTLCDRCFAIWNGTSRGTKYTYDYAVKLGKPADIRVITAKDKEQRP